ncbi:MAG: TonB-dependent receptor plug domain-containing protein [Gemmatimonadetes bacterium]|nr:TonB-dependent receptor plug domain-containing protein [Gemmatimonadota bacterium]MYC90451.1 TonB-dependent receptor plug domain-containing protein [Gemmatimonadota bacterium]MYG34797.1 TonB-dependent receptor plug domain-containing protein [Gemmatimonadota bacterium]
MVEHDSRGGAGAIGRPTMRGPAITALAATLALAPWLPGPAAAQTIRGTVTDPASGAVVAEAVVIMVNGDGERVATMFTAPDGTFALTPPGPGTYMIGVSGLGYQQAISPQLQVGNDDVQLDIYLPPDPVTLDSITVVSTRNTPDAGRLRGLLTTERHRGTLVGRLTRAEIESRGPRSDLISLLNTMNIPGLTARWMALSTGAPETGVCVELGRNRSVLQKTASRLSIAPEDQLGFANQDDIAARADACAMMAVYVDDFPISDPGMVLAAITPDDLETVEILPALESLARYGARAANGALLLQTRAGRRD